VIPVLGLSYTSKDKEREVSKDFVEIATKILQEDPNPHNKPLRNWAIDLINSYSTVKLSDEARNVLLNEQPLFQSSTIGSVTKQRIEQIKSAYVLGVVVPPRTTPNFWALKERGVQFVFIKASQGLASSNALAKQQADQARAAGLKVGLYHYFESEADVSAQFANFSHALGSIAFDLPPTIDCETFGGGTPAAGYADRVAEMASKLQQSYKRKVIVYTTLSFGNEYLSPKDSTAYLFIADLSRRAGDAQKPSIPKWWTEYTFWHLAESVSDDDVLKGYDIVGFNGKPEQLAGL
jgi:lysozyme